MPLMEKQRRASDPERPGYAVFKKGPRIGLFVLILLATLALGGLMYLSSGAFQETSDEQPDQEEISTGEQATEDTTIEEEDIKAPPPEDPTLYLTVPRLGIYGHTVRNDRSEEALGLGAIKLPKTGFPWEKGDVNTYIACHRLGFPGTESFNQCLNLHWMQQGDQIFLEDANGTVYEYRVSETLTVGPQDTWVTKPIEGRDVVSLQTCIEAPGDFVTLGPNWTARFIVRADRVS